MKFTLTSLTGKTYTGSVVSRSNTESGADACGVSWDFFMDCIRARRAQCGWCKIVYA